MNLELLVSFLETQPGAIGRLLGQHSDAGDGDCLSCGTGLRWPCTIYTAALAANKRRIARLVEFFSVRSFRT